MSNGHDSWKAKVHPAFLKIGKLWNDFQKGAVSSGPDGTTRNAQELRAEVVRTRDELLKRYPDLRPGSPSNHVTAASQRFLSQRDIVTGMMEWLCWRRFGHALASLLAEQKAGSLEAHKRVLRVRDEFWRLVYGNSAVVPFKGTSTHSDIMELGLNLGLDKLTAEELADCFDEVCPCGKTHDPDALKKQRVRVRKQLERARYESLRAIPPRQRFAACGAHGITARANQPARGIPFVDVSQHGNKTECLIYPDGTALITENSQFWGRDGLKHLTEAFGVEDPIELFSMFFPEFEKLPYARAR